MSESERERVSRWNLFKRNYYIKKRFQANFAVKFLVLIVLESILAIIFFTYLSKGTLITGFSGSEVVVARTGEYFLPTLLLTNLVVIGLTAAAGFVVLLVVSHKIAGPLWRFEKTLEETSSGDLTRRFNLRTDDQMHDLARRMNEFNYRMDSMVSDLQRGLDDLSGELGEIADAAGSPEPDGERLKKLSRAAAERVEGLRAEAGYFKTTGSERSGR